MLEQSIPLLRENDATDERVREAFRDIKLSLRVPIVNSVFLAYAAVPKFLDLTWRRLRPIALARRFAAQAAGIGTLVTRGTEDWPIGDHAALLRARAISEFDIGRMREFVGLFSVVNPKLLILTAAVQAALSGIAVGGVGTAGPAHGNDEGEKPEKEFRGVRLQLTDERDAPPRVRFLYEDMKATFHWPFVDTEYRAMATYPDWLELWWKDCKLCSRDPRFQTLSDQIAAASQQAALGLPHRLVIGDSLLAANEIDALKREQLQRVNASFMHLLPQLIINVEIARRGLGA